MKKPKNPAAVELGRKGGLSAAGKALKSLTPEERSRRGREAARARWAKSGRKRREEEEGEREQPPSPAPPEEQ